MSTPSWNISQSGESSRKRFTFSTTRFATKSTSSSVLNRPRPKRIDECARSSPRPNARNTYDGSNEADVHALPLLTATTLFKAIKQLSPSTYANDTFKLPGKRCSHDP